ncbi:hypothetical protein B0H11DRAFT_484493 [Mycena galericulata]|nr:hypothetical protein B0H11DRAFT_484493 [Mycena galericulata]
MSALSAVLLSLAVLTPILSSAAPLSSRTFVLNSTAPTQYLENAITAQFMNQQFAALSETDPCTGNATACIGGSFAMCVSEAWALTPCASGLVCAALPQSSTLGTVLSCDSLSDISQHFAFAGVDSGPGNATDVSGDDGCDDSGSGVEGNATSALPAAPVSSSNSSAVSVPVRRFHRRQLSNTTGDPAVIVNGLSTVPLNTAPATSVVAVPSISVAVTGTTTFAPSAITSASVSTGISTTSALSAPATTASISAAGSPGAEATTVIGADGLPTALVVVTVPATGPAVACTTSAQAVPSAPAAGAAALPADPTSIALAAGVIPTTTSTLTVTAGATTVPDTGATGAASSPAIPSASDAGAAATGVSVLPNPLTSAAASVPLASSAAAVPSVLPNPANGSVTASPAPASVEGESVVEASSAPIVAASSVPNVAASITSVAAAQSASVAATSSASVVEASSASVGSSSPAAAASPSPTSPFDFQT